ncbi:MAG: sigma 54-interacting transcriptional regulator [Planctomycetes bacterium]|nr:sigma 54-interacting transcriptional regulator [Planctomycetota bacterium]
MPAPPRPNRPAAPADGAVDDLARQLQQALVAGTSREEVNELLAGALAALAHLLPFDLAAILELDGDELAVRVAHGPLDSDKVRRHRLKLADFPSVRRALKEGRAVRFAEHDHADGDGDPYDGILDLPHGHHCMVVPLAARETLLGAMTFDRAQCGNYAPGMVELAEIFGRLLALAMSFGEQTRALTLLREQLVEGQRLLREAVEGPTSAGAKLAACTSAPMQRVVELARKVAGSTMPVLLTGETGTGKEICARAIHEWSPRAEQPLVSLNCAALPAGTVESELFGHVKGAYSGAVHDRLGRFQVANGGTLFLDEVGDLPLELQAKLLRVLQEGCFEPVGSDRTVKVDVRVIAATNADLQQAVAAKRFREDLYWRLAVFPIELPPLRERRDEVVALAQRHLAELARRNGRAPLQLTEAAQRALQAAPWRGNVRELLNVLERATLLASGGAIDVAELLLERGALPPAPPSATATERAAPAAPAALPPIGSAPLTLEAAERLHIEQTLARTGGRIYGEGGAAQLLDVPPSTLRSRMEKLGLGGARDFQKRSGGA